MAVREGRIREAHRLWALDRAANIASGGTVAPLAASLDSVDINTWVLNQPEAGLRQLEALLARTQPAQWTLPMANRFAWLGRPARAKEILARVEARSDSITMRTQRGPRQNTAAFIAAAEGRYTDAVAEFRASDRLADGPRLLCPICVDVGIATSFDRAGMADSAIAAYEHFVTAPYHDRIVHEYQLAWVLRRIGQLYEDKKEPQKALDAYRKFVELWKNADAEVQPQVEEVKGKIKGLEAELARRG
jgi:tetratricopeptide (TPR) repeat protein